MAEAENGAGGEVGWLALAAMVSLTNDADTVVAEVVERVREHEAADEAVVAGVVEGSDVEVLVREVAGLLGEALRARRPLDASETAVVSERADGMIATGAPLEIVRQAVHATCAVVLDRLATAGQARPAEAPPELLGRLFGIVADCEFDLLGAIGAAARSVGDDDATRDERLREAFLHRVLEGPVHDPVATARQGRALKLDLTPPFGLVLLIEPLGWTDDPSTESFEEQVLRCRRRPEQRLLPAVFVEPDPAVPQSAILVVPAHAGEAAEAVEEALIEERDASGLLFVTATAASIGEIPAVYHRMRRIVPVMPRCARHLDAVPTLDAVLPYWSAERLPDVWAEYLLRAEVGPLMASVRTSRLVHTWLLLVRERLTDAEAAERLHVAPGTVRKRRRTIEGLTGRRPGPESFHAQLASYVYELWEPDLPVPGDPWWTGDDASAD